MSESPYPREVLEFIVGPPDGVAGSPDDHHSRLKWDCGCVATVATPGRYGIIACDEHRSEFDEETL
jgi:hypothetical protein